MRKLGTLILATVLAASCSQGGKLTCNYHAADISTLEGEATMLAGFAARNDLSTGIHLPLNTHCLVISDGSDKVCIISNDLM